MDPRSIGDHTIISIHNNDISQVSSYKYLGVQIDKDMSWSKHVAFCCAKIHQRLHFLRRLRLFGVSANIMLIFYRASIESILRYGIASWFGNLTVHTIFEQAVVRQSRNIISDTSHVLNPEYVIMRTGRRYRTPTCKYNRYKHSFVPLSIKLLNDN